jgi:type II secretory pathway pseudopilin PulG
MTRAARQSGSRAARVGRVILNPPPQFLRPLPRRVKDNAPYLSPAFTLIELMVVVGLIMLMVGGLSLSLGDTGGNSLASAQKMIGSLVGSARAQAAVNQTEARVLVYGTRPPSGDSDKFLRLLQVFIANPEGSNTWVPVGSPVYLPRGLYVVPTSTAGLLASGVIWPTNPAPLSTLGTTTGPGAAQQPVGTAFNAATTVFYVEFEADGTIKPATSPYFKFIVATGALSSANLPAFNNAGALRGVLIRPSGAVTFVNAATGF